mmetsp:Transcript_18208/g.59837  ORF Transcript_18208/g.59837 Transcript_18208/m.59837 type:complete len:133 (+) Transcript_18208:1225-1623(+)
MMIQRYYTFTTLSRGISSMRRTLGVFVRILSSSSACRLYSHALACRERDMSFDVLSPLPRIRIAPGKEGEEIPGCVLQDLFFHLDVVPDLLAPGSSPSLRRKEHVLLETVFEREVDPLIHNLRFVRLRYNPP